MKIALSNRFAVVSEILESVHAAGHDAAFYKTEDELDAALDSMPDIVFALDINFHENIRAVCAERNIPYAVWTFDSGAAAKAGRSAPLRENDYLFLFNSLDCERIKAFHHNAFYLPFSAGNSMYLPARQDNFEYEVLAVMNSYRQTAVDAEKTFREAAAAAPPETAKQLELAKSLLDIAAQKHADILDCDRMEEFLDQFVAGCGVDPFGGNPNRKISACKSYGQILSSAQREKCLRAIADHGFKLDVFGDSYWKSVFASAPNVFCHSFAQYSGLNILYNSAKININLTQVQNIASVPQRIFHLLASGAFALTNDSAELRKLFTPGLHLETFRSPSELAEKIAYYLRNEAARVKIAEAGQKEFYEKHRMDLRLAQIFSTVAGR